LKSSLESIEGYFRENLGIYTFVTLIFLAGIVTGALLVRFLDETQITELSEHLSVFQDNIEEKEEEIFEPRQLLMNSYQRNIIFLIITYLLGMLWLGFPFILLILLLRGAALGFTVGFIVYDSAFQGLIFSFAAVLPHNILLVPSYIISSAVATTYSLLKLKGRFSSKHLSQSYFPQYCFLMVVMLLVVLMGGIVEAYITPALIKISLSII